MGGGRGRQQGMGLRAVCMHPLHGPLLMGSFFLVL